MTARGRGHIALILGALMALLPLRSADAQSGRSGKRVTVHVGNPGDHWAGGLEPTYIGRARQGGVYGYKVTLRDAGDGCEATIFYPRAAIDSRGDSPGRYRRQKMRVATGWLYYPSRLTATSLPEVHRGVLYIEAHYARQADGAIAAAEGFALVAGAGMLVPGPRVPVAASRTGAAAGAVGRSKATAGAGTQAAARGFSSFAAFKRAMGPAGKGMHWHHIVEKGGPNVARFGAERIHSTANIIRLDAATHRKVSALYSRISAEATGSTTLTVRQWLRSQTFEAQHAFGLRAIEKVISGVW